IMGGSRRQFTVAFKKKAIAYAEIHGNLAAQRKFGVSEKSTGYWRGQRQKLAACSKAKKTSFRGRTAVYPELKTKVANVIRDLRARSLLVTSECIRTKAVEVACASGL
ncbi:hypothetical protein HPB47_027702, partial [Ixodes persulcatus]